MRITDIASEYLEQRIPHEHAEIHARLLEWGRWARSRPRQGHVASLEGRYRAPRGAEIEWELAVPLPPPLPPPSDPDSLAIELVWRHLPTRHARALKLIYVKRYSVWECRRQLHVNVKAWPEFIYKARQMVINLLQKEKHGRTEYSRGDETSPVRLRPTAI